MDKGQILRQDTKSNPIKAKHDKIKSRTAQRQAISERLSVMFMSCKRTLSKVFNLYKLIRNIPINGKGKRVGTSFKRKIK